MAVAVIATDTWLSHLEFTGGRRPSAYGPYDGVFYGVVSGIGDASAGNFTLNGNISFDRKEDWVYIIQKVSMTRNDTLAGEDAFIVVSTGPVIPTSSAVANPSFHVASDMKGVTNNSVTVFQRSNGAETPFKDLVVFGDKRIDGPVSMVAGGFENNSLNTSYQLSIFGLLVRYNGFFRNVGGSFG